MTAKRTRRSPTDMVRALQEQIARLEHQRRLREFGQDPSVKTMRIVRKFLNKGLNLAAPDAPLPTSLLDHGRDFLATLDTALSELGIRLQPRRGRQRRAPAAAAEAADR